jgi:small subunit ribosomal protein S1
VGNDYPAKVVSIQKYGAFVDLGGGVEGLIHISELAHGRVDRVEDMLNVGEAITVRLLGITPGEKGAAPKLRLSLRALSHAEASAEPETGEVLEGTVSKVSQYGVHVDTAKGTGLVPTRELGTPRNSDNRRMFPIGKPVSVVLMSKDASRGITFSMARVAKVEERQNYRDFAKAQRSQQGETSNVGSFGALLQRELKLPEPSPAPKAQPAPAQTNQRPPSPPARSGAQTPPGAPGEPPAREEGPPAPPPRAPKAVFSGPPPTDRTRVDTTPPPKPAPPKKSDFGVVRGRRRPKADGT